LEWLSEKAAQVENTTAFSGLSGHFGPFSQNMSAIA
jgi:hypothetical protein